MSVRSLVVVNPRSRNGSTGRRWMSVENRVRAALGSLDVEYTRTPRDAERIAREGVRAGVQRLIVAGGDGTVSEVVTGLLAADLARYAEIGLLPLGTGGDFARTLGVPKDLDEALAILAEGRVQRIDAGRIRYRDWSSREAVAYFVNVTSLGISGLIDQLVNRATKRFGGTASFLIGTIKAIARYRSQHVTLRVDGEVIHDAPLLLATAANGRYFGGGMHVAPQARLDDGLFDVMIVSDLSKPRLIAKLPSLYAGTHLDDPASRVLRGGVIEADAAPGTVLLDVDGEPLGSLPARIEIFPGALKVIGAAR